MRVRATDRCRDLRRGCQAVDKPREESWCLQLLGANTAAAVMMLPEFHKGDGQRTISAGPGKFIVPNACGFLGAASTGGECSLLAEVGAHHQ
jgi:hypothetical protein